MKYRHALPVLAVCTVLSLLLAACAKEPGIIRGSTEERPQEDIVYETTGEQAYAGYTGESLTVSLADNKYGGPQFVAKLFTEGLSRAPQSEEYLHYISQLEEKGCTQETLTALAMEFFSAKPFKQAKLDKKQTIFAVYRAVLNRDPTEEELAREEDGKDAAALAETLCGTEEFAALIPAINKGPYYWGENILTAYTGGKIITSDELRAMFEKDIHVKLPQGALVLMDSMVSIPKGGTLETEGNPTHYTKMARLIRKNAGDHHLVFLRDDSSLKNVYVEGNLSSYDIESVLSGSNVVVGGKNCTVQECRISDSVSHQNLWAFDASEHGYLGSNLITGYASDHSKTWQDGITCLGADFLIEYNEIVDLTDASIAIFRYVNELGGPEQYYVRAQNTIVRHNKILNMGNSSYAGYDHETGNYIYDKINGPIHPANMTGLVAYENQIWTSMRAHIHMLVTMSTVPWLTEANCDLTVGGSVYNNYTPEGCYALTACGIAVDKAIDVAVRGNQFRMYLADWCRAPMKQRLYAVNESNCEGDFQAGFVNKAMTMPGLAFIVTLKEGLELEAAEEIFLEEGIIFEEKQTIPVERFASRTLDE